MKTKALALLLCACMLFSLAACAQRDPDVPEGFLLYENEDADYYFYYPEGWIKNRGDAGETSVYVSETDFSSVSVNAFTFSSEYASLTDYAERFYVPELEKHFSSVKVDYNQDGSLKTSVLKIDDCDAISFSYSATLGEEYSFRVWFISYNGYLYSVLYTAKADLYDTNFNAAEQIALNIQFK